MGSGAGNRDKNQNILSGHPGGGSLRGGLPCRNALAASLLVHWCFTRGQPAFGPGRPRYSLRHTAAEAEVRSGPSTEPMFYPTNRLHRGDQVEVISEREGGWLQIRPPEGSFSYISARFLSHIVPTQPNFVVTSEKDEVPVYIGSEIITDRRPTVVGVKLKRGAQVFGIGKVRTDSEGAFMPIEAPANECRYIRADVVAKQLPVPGPVSSASATGGSTFTATGPLQPSNAPSANPPLTPEMLWQNAQQAERARADQRGHPALRPGGLWGRANQPQPGGDGPAAAQLPAGRPSSLRRAGPERWPCLRPPCRLLARSLQGRVIPRAEYG